MLMETIIGNAEKFIRNLFDEESLILSQNQIDEWVDVNFNYRLREINNFIVPVENYVDIINYVNNYHWINNYNLPLFPIQIKHVYNCFLFIVARCKYSNFYDNNYCMLNEPEFYIST